MKTYKVSKKIFLKKIQEEFPDIRSNKVKHIVEGMDHYVLLIDDKHLFRFPRNDKYAKPLFEEVKLLDYLNTRKLGVAIPKYEFIPKDKSFAGYTFIRGDQLKKDVFKSLPEKNRLLLAKQLGRFLARFHNTPLDDIKRFGVKSQSGKKAYLEFSNDVRKFLKDKLSTKDLSVIDQFQRDSKAYLDFPHPALTHSDLWMNHILIDDSQTKLVGILDFSDRCIFDPAIDFAELWNYGKEFVEQTYKNYAGKKDKDFLYRSLMYFKRVPIKMMIHPLKYKKGNFRESLKFFREVFLA